MYVCKWWVQNKWKYTSIHICRYDKYVKIIIILSVIYYCKNQLLNFHEYIWLLPNPNPNYQYHHHYYYYHHHDHYHHHCYSNYHHNYSWYHHYHPSHLSYILILIPVIIVIQESTLYKKRRRYIAWNSKPAVMAAEVLKYKVIGDAFMYICIYVLY
jgi:hypothetical protein